MFILAIGCAGGVIVCAAIDIPRNTSAIHMRIGSADFIPIIVTRAAGLRGICVRAQEACVGRCWRLHRGWCIRWRWRDCWRVGDRRRCSWYRALFAHHDQPALNITDQNIPAGQEGINPPGTIE